MRHTLRRTFSGSPCAACVHARTARARTAVCTHSLCSRPPPGRGGDGVGAAVASALAACGAPCSAAHLVVHSGSATPGLSRRDERQCQHTETPASAGLVCDAYDVTQGAQSAQFQEERNISTTFSDPPNRPLPITALATAPCTLRQHQPAPRVCSLCCYPKSRGPSHSRTDARTDAGSQGAEALPRPTSTSPEQHKLGPRPCTCPEQLMCPRRNLRGEGCTDRVLRHAHTLVAGAPDHYGLGT